MNAARMLEVPEQLKTMKNGGEPDVANDARG